MGAIQERLRRALDEQGYTIRKLHLTLKERDVPGSKSYASVHGYLQGGTMPGLEFLEAAANELGVRLAWLVAGEGEMTAQEQGLEKHRPLEQDLLALCARYPWLEALPRSLKRRFRDLWIDYTLQVPGARVLWKEDPPGWEEQRLAIADDLVQLLLLPQRAWGLHLPLQSNAVANLVLYLDRAIAALEVLIPVLHKGEPLTTWPRSPLPKLRDSDHDQDERRASSLTKWLEEWREATASEPREPRVEGGIVRRKKRL